MSSRQAFIFSVSTRKDKIWGEWMREELAAGDGGWDRYKIEVSTFRWWEYAFCGGGWGILSFHAPHINRGIRREASNWLANDNEIKRVHSKKIDF